MAGQCAGWVLAADRRLKASDRADVELVLGALEYTVWGRGLDGAGDPAQRRLIHHSDRGAQPGFNRSSQHGRVGSRVDGR